MMKAELRGIKFEIEYTDGLFSTTKDLSLYFSSIKNTETAVRIQGAVEAVREALPKVIKAEGNWQMQVNLYGLDKWYKGVDGARYIIDKMDGKVTYRKWVDSHQCYDVDCEVVYRKKNGDMDRAKMVKEICERLQFDATAMVLDFGRIEYDLSV